MKKILLFLLPALMLTACSKDDEQPIDENLIQGHWYAEMPMTGTTQNWRTEEEGDMTDYDHVGIILFINTEANQGYWSHLFLKDGEVVNVAGFGASAQEQNRAYFTYQLDGDGNFTLAHYTETAPPVAGMRYTNGTITSTVEGKPFVFRRPEDMGKTDFLDDVWEMLAEAGMGGYDDGDDHLNTDISDKPADEPSRSR